MMFNHIELGNTAFSRMRKLKMLIIEGKVVLGGNRRLKIYGTLSCKSGRRMKTGNRVFFSSEEEAIACGYRACGNCLRDKYRQQHE